MEFFCTSVRAAEDGGDACPSEVIDDGFVGDALGEVDGVVLEGEAGHFSDDGFFGCGHLSGLFL